MMQLLLVIMTVGISNHAQADWYKYIHCETNLIIEAKNKNRKFSRLKKKSFLLPEENAVLLKGFSKKGAELITLYPWGGIHFSLTKMAKVKTKKTDGKSFLELEIYHKKEIYNINCRKKMTPN